MSNGSINEEINDDLMGVKEEVPHVPQQHIVEKPSIVEMLKTPTGEGTIEEYLIHPLNFNESKGMARVLRGLTGFLGNINLAIADIIIGALDVLKTSPKKGSASNDGGVSSLS